MQAAEKYCSQLSAVSFGLIDAGVLFADLFRGMLAESRARGCSHYSVPHCVTLLNTKML